MAYTYIIGPGRYSVRVPAGYEHEVESWWQWATEEEMGAVAARHGIMYPFHHAASEDSNDRTMAALLEAYAAEFVA